jgi:hypothetical protein
MRATRVWIPVSCCVLALAVYAWAQGRKAGLYEVTTDMTWQQSPFPAGMGPGAHGPRTSQVCVTQAQIDKYGDLGALELAAGGVDVAAAGAADVGWMPAARLLLEGGDGAADGLCRRCRGRGSRRSG